MIKSNDKRVTELIDDLERHACDRYQIVDAIRRLIEEQRSELAESIKYGGLVYHRNNELLAGIFAYKAHVSLELSNGFTINDKFSVLEGNGKQRRHIKYRCLSEVADKHTDYYLSEALK